MSVKKIPSRNLSHSYSCKRVCGWIMGAKHPCTCGAEEREDARVAMVKDAMRYRWLKGRYRAADFNYGAEGVPVLLFDFPDCPVSANLDATIDRELKRTENC